MDRSANDNAYGATTAFREWLAAVVSGWNRFWFAPSDPATLSAIRVLAGLMLLYTHLVWSLDLEAFFGPQGWISIDAAWRNYGGPELAEDGKWSYFWSWFFWIESPQVLWTVHIAGLVVVALFTLGLFSRVTGLLSYVIALAYVHRAPGALFGLDQINTMLVMYLWIGPCGACYSLDAWLARRRAAKDAAQVEPTPPSSAATVAVRFIQLHMCVIYLFAGLGKLGTGGSWWTGMGIWGGIANLEYQSIDATWLADWPLVLALVSHLTVYWEIFYCALVWPRATRWLMLAIAVPMHLGIAIFMGMITFGLVMLIGNAAFIPPHVTRAVVRRLTSFNHNPI